MHKIFKEFTPSQIKNLNHLADYLADGCEGSEMEFRMEEFLTIPGYGLSEDYPSILLDDQSEKANICGSSACAIGHGPLAGVDPKKYECWTEYAARCFNVFMSQGDVAGEFMFGCGWDLTKHNKPLDASARIRYFLKHKAVPDDFGLYSDCGESIYSLKEPYHENNVIFLDDFRNRMNVVMKEVHNDQEGD